MGEKRKAEGNAIEKNELEWFITSALHHYDAQYGKQVKG